MELLADMIRNLLVIIIVSGFLEALLPEGHVKPLVRFAIGLFVIVAVLSPALQWLYHDRHYQVNSWDLRGEAAQQQPARQRGERLREDLQQGSGAHLEEKLQGQVNAIALLVPGVGEVHTDLSMKGGALEGMQVTVRTASGAEIGQVGQVGAFAGADADNAPDRQKIKERLVQVLHQLYGIEPAKITVSFEGGS